MTRLWTTRALALGSLMWLLGSGSAGAAPKVDFNGDGRADVFTRNVFTGEMTAWIVNSNGGAQTVAMGTVAPSTMWAPVSTGDFNGDRRTDLLWYNSESGQLGVWLLDGARLLQGDAYGGASRESGWVPIAAEDFNGDSRTDVLWYNTLAGQLVVWLLDGLQLLQAPVLGTAPPSSGWLPFAAEDLSGDGRTDLLWSNVYTGDVAAWLVNGGQVTPSAVFGSQAPNTGWTPAAVKDFSGDGRGDLLWYNVHSGELTIWLLDGLRTLQALPLSTVSPSLGWFPLATEDVSGEGRADLLWIHPQTGHLVVWIFTASGSQAASYGAVNPSWGWSIAGFDDYNGDARADLFWSNVFSGGTAVWHVNGATIQGASYGNLPPPTIWQAQVPR